MLEDHRIVRLQWIMTTTKAPTMPDFLEFKETSKCIFSKNFGMKTFKSEFFTH